MSRRLPIIHKLRKICIICEGDEEVDYINRLIELKVWNEKYDVKLLNAGGNGNIAARYQDAFQSGDFDMVFAFVDTDRAPHDQYIDIKRKINDIYGIEKAADLVVIFGNPCTMQIIILHFADEKLNSHKKSENKEIIKKYTGIDSYNAKKAKREALFSLIDLENYEIMKERVRCLSCDDEVKNSSNFINLLNWLSDESEQWLEELEMKLDTI